MRIANRPARHIGSAGKPGYQHPAWNRLTSGNPFEGLERWHYPSRPVIRKTISLVVSKQDDLPELTAQHLGILQTTCPNSKRPPHPTVIMEPVYACNCPPETNSPQLPSANSTSCPSFASFLTLLNSRRRKSARRTLGASLGPGRTVVHFR